MAHAIVAAEDILLARIRELQKDLDELRAERSKLTAEIAHLNARDQGLSGVIGDLQRALNAITPGGGNPNA